MQPLPLARRHAAWLAAAAVLVVAGCAQTKLVVHAAKEIKAAAAPEEKPTGVYKVGTPYQVDGVWYYPAVDYAYSATGIASWYGEEFHGRRTANGETFDMNAVTAAHKALPLPSVVRVTNLENGRSIIVRVNDRGPFMHGRIIDLSRRGAQLLGFEREGTAKVRVEILPDESRQLALSLPRTPGEAEGGPAVKAAPRVAVEAEELPPPGAVPAPERKVALHSEKWASIAPTRAPEAAAAPEPVVTYEPVRLTSIYIQAGAFVQFDNANRLRAKLSPLGRVRVTPVKLGEQEMFRVRLGPVATVEEADQLLERLIGTGYTDARLIVVE
jgi:rare lipoprotein A